MKRAMPLLATAGVVAVISCAGVGPADASAQTSYCKVVTAETLTFYDSASATGGDGYLVHGQHFYTDRTDAPYNRYHVEFSPGIPEGWVSSDPAWTNASTGC